MESQVPTKKVRKYYIDWLRILLILSVFLYHIGMFFNGWGWHVKNDIAVEWLHPIMEFLHYWRMPLLFLVSGVGTYYALGFRTTKQYVKERSIRLFIPFIAGIFILVPVQVYIEKIGQYDSLLAFYPNMFDGIYPEGNFSWHHLWFLIYLFFISLLIAPFLNYLKGKKFQKLRAKLLHLSAKKLGLNWMLILLVGSQATLRQYFPDSTHALFDDWAYFTYYLLFFLAGFILITDDNLVEKIKEQRNLYLTQAVIFTAIMFASPYVINNATILNYFYGTSGIALAWSCGLAAIGYAKKYLNSDSKLRKLANEGIYPFYLLHQPIIIVLGYYTAQWQGVLLLKFITLTSLSFILAVGIYWYLIRPFNFMRIIFGLKVIKREKIRTPELLPLRE